MGYKVIFSRIIFKGGYLVVCQHKKKQDQICIGYCEKNTTWSYEGSSGLGQDCRFWEKADVAQLKLPNEKDSECNDKECYIKFINIWNKDPLCMTTITLSLVKDPERWATDRKDVLF